VQKDIPSSGTWPQFGQLASLLPQLLQGLLSEEFDVPQFLQVAACGSNLL